MKFCLIFLLASFSLISKEVDIINLKGSDYLISSNIPEEIVGLYEYNSDNGEPVVKLNADGTGLFQPHGVPAIPIKFWIHMDPDGNPHREIGNELRYRYTLLVQYGVSNNTNYRAGEYDLFGVTMLKDEGIAVVFDRKRKL